jgi:uncharacterized protein (TIGR02246 family)
MTVAEVDAVAQAFHDGVAAQDAEALASLYTEEGRFLAPNMPPCEGRAAIQAAMQGLFDMGARSLDVQSIETREEGAVTIEYGHYTLGIETGNGEAMTDVGKYVVVHEDQGDGSTKIVLDIFNSSSPVPAL